MSRRRASILPGDSIKSISSLFETEMKSGTGVHMGFLQGESSKLDQSSSDRINIKVFLMDVALNEPVCDKF